MNTLPGNFQDADSHNVAAVVRAIDQAWTNHDLERLNSLFAEDIVILGPDGSRLASDRKACIASYADFLRNANVTSFNPSAPVVYVTGDIATAAYSWEITYTMHQQEFHEFGSDVYVLRKSGPSWQAICRMVLPAKH